MAKIVMTRDEVIEVIKSLKNEPQLSKYKFGLAGSYARGKQNKRSDIDIIYDGDDINIEQMIEIEQKFKGQKVDILSMPMLEQGEKEEIEFLTGRNMPLNDESVYNTIKRDVIWFK